MALANIAWILATAGYRVLVLDWDLEAPGLHRYFRPFLIDKELTASEGIIDYIIKFCDEAIQPVPEGRELPPDWYLKFADITQYRISLDFEGFPLSGKIDFICAGQQGPSYATRVNSFNWQDFYQRLGGGAFINATREKMRSKYDYILVDSRTGVSDTAGICTVQLPDTLAIFFTYNNQSITGASAVAQSVSEQRKNRTEGNHGFRILPVPTRVDQTELDKLDQRRVYARQSFASFIEDIPELDRANYWTNVEVPYVAWFAYEEVLSIFRDSPGDPKTVLASLKRIADFVVQPEIDRLSFELLLSPDEKQLILSEFAATPSRPAETKKAVTIATETPLEEATRVAELNFLALTQKEQQSARELWLRLVRVPRPGERVENTKVRVPLDELDEIPGGIVDRFISANLLIKSRDDSYAETIEVANEDLLRNWKRLQAWIDEDRDFLLWRQQLQNRLAEWHTDKSAKGLLRADEITTARTWSDKEHDLSASERRYVQLSLDAERRRKSRLGLWSLIAIGVVALVIGGLVAANWYRKRAARINLARTLKTQAEEIADNSALLTGKPRIDRLQLAVLLEIESNRLNPLTETQQLIVKHLSQLPRRMFKSSQEREILQTAITGDGSKVVAITGARRSLGATGGEEKTAVIQDISSKKQIAILNFSADSAWLGPDGKICFGFVGATNPNGSIAGSALRVWYPEKPERGFTLNVNRSLLAGRPIISPDGRFLVIRSSRGINAFDIEASLAKGVPVPEPRLTTVGEGRFSIIAFDYVADHVAIGSGNGPGAGVTVRSLRANTANNTREPENRFIRTGSAFDMSLSPTGRLLATSDAGKIHVWNVETSQELKTLETPDATGLYFTLDEKRLVTSEIDENTTYVDLATGKQQILAKAGEVETFIPAGDGRLFAGISGNTVRIWHYNGIGFDESFVFLDGTINDVGLNGDNWLLSAGGVDKSLIVWDLKVPSSLTEIDYCARLTRNLTAEEWTKYMVDTPYQQPCPAPTPAAAY